MGATGCGMTGLGACCAYAVGAINANKETPMNRGLICVVLSFLYAFSL